MYLRQVGSFIFFQKRIEIINDVIDGIRYVHVLQLCCSVAVLQCCSVAACVAVWFRD